MLFKLKIQTVFQPQNTIQQKKGVFQKEDAFVGYWYTSLCKNYIYFNYSGEFVKLFFISTQIHPFFKRRILNKEFRMSKEGAFRALPVQ